MSLSRRSFLEAAVLTPLWADNKIPRRILGRTGVQVSILAFGCGSRLLAYKHEDQALEALTYALDRGVNYLDTAYGYGNGLSETWVGRLMPQRRKDVFLATKVNARKADDAMRIIEGSLQRLKTTQVDLLHIHSLTSEEDLAAIEAPDGVLKAVYRARDEKMARFIGITCHSDPVVLKKALERHDFDCTQMALNAARAGMQKGRGALGEPVGDTFEAVALPVAKKKNLGVIAMKIFAQDGLAGKAPAEKLIRYSLSLPVATAVIGMPKLEFVEQNLAVVRSFRPMSLEEMEQISGELRVHKAELDRFFAQHVDV
jgi:predicted aldo/keto reductase-like oxidoreductase